MDMVLGIGTDIIEINRIESSIKKWGDDFIRHIFTDKEIDYCKKYKRPFQHFAVRFAAKEAVYKAISNNPKLSWKNIEILNDVHGKPTCRLIDIVCKHKILISLSHSKHYAVASAIITS